MDAPRSSSSTRDLRIVQVMECTIGGTRRHIGDLSGGLADRGAEVHLVAAAERQPDFREDLEALAERGCVIHELPMRRSISPLRDPAHCLALTRILKRVDPHVVHTHSSKAGVLGRLAAIATGVTPRVHTFHTPAFLFREMFSAWKRSLFYQLEKNLAAHTTRLVAVSASEARTLLTSEVIGEEKLEVVPNGIDPSPFADARPIDLAAVGLDPERTTASVIGLLNVAKGQDWAIEALARPGNEGLQLLVVGHGERLDFLRGLAEKLGVSGRVAFLGFRRDVPALLAASDLLLLPSRWEGLPYVALEAMATGVPVVATPVDGAVDVIETGRNGWLAEAVDGEAFARTLAETLALPRTELRRAGDRGREVVLTGYTVDAMVDRHADLYAGLR